MIEEYNKYRAIAEHNFQRTKRVGLTPPYNVGLAASCWSVNQWKIPTFESNGPMCFFMMGKNHVTFGFLRARRGGLCHMADF